MREHQQLVGTILCTGGSVYQSLMPATGGHSKHCKVCSTSFSLGVCGMQCMLCTVYCPHQDFFFQCNFFFPQQCLFSSWEKQHIPIFNGIHIKFRKFASFPHSIHCSMELIRQNVYRKPKSSMRTLAFFTQKLTRRHMLPDVPPERQRHSPFSPVVRNSSACQMYKSSDALNFLLSCHQ